MDKKTCSIEDCPRPHKARGLCDGHYRRLRRTGSAGEASLVRQGEGMTAKQRLASRSELEPESGCLVWQGPVNDNGYGLMKVDGKMRSTHRLAFELENGPIPDGMVVDHTCFVRNCVNPSHMRLATVAQNNRSLSGRRKNDGGLPRGVIRRGVRYLAQIRQNGVTLYLGTYGTPEEAGAAASAKRQELWGEFAGAV